MEVEARMKRTIYMPQRRHSRPVRPQLPTVQEQGREQKSIERFSPVRRGSEGSAGGPRTLSPSTPQQECQRLQRGLQSRSSPPRSIPGSPIHQQEAASPVHHLYSAAEMGGEIGPGALGGYDRNPFVPPAFNVFNPLLSPSGSPVFGAGSSISSITQGLSGLNTTGSGSITQGTPSQFGAPPDDAKMAAFLHQVPHHMHVLNVHGHRSLTNSPISNPGSPGLDMIQEEAAQQLSKPEGHPQISVTDVLGSEVTLVAGSDTSEDSMDSLENSRAARIPSFVISEPSENLPSITRGIGRKTSQEAAADDAAPQHSEEFFLRRNSCYSDDSLSNDSVSLGNQSPSSSSNTQSSHAFEGDYRSRAVDSAQLNRELSNAGGPAQNFQIFQELKLKLGEAPGTHKNSGSFEFELSDFCSKLHANDILEMVKRTIHDQIPPKQLLSLNDVNDRLSLEYEGGIQIELKVVDKPRDSKGLKMRRISGDHLVYNQLCQQLISCMTVS